MYNIESITALALKLAEEYKKEMDACKVNEDLDALFQEIAVALSEHGYNGLGMMRRYSRLMQKEQDVYDPYTVYEAGRRAANEENRIRAFMQYLCGLMLEPGNQEILQERDGMFYKMCDILSGDERRLLLSDYNEVYRQYHGAISRRFSYFFDLGYYMVDEINKGLVTVYMQLTLLPGGRQ